MLIANLLVLVMMKMKAIWLLYTWADRKSTRLNSSHSQISYAVFCLKKKKISLVSRHVFFISGHLSPVAIVPWMAYRTSALRNWVAVYRGYGLRFILVLCITVASTF